MNDQYICLNKAQLSFEYLHTNSTTHTFLFGALAELVDNSKDAGAKNLDIFTCKDPSLRGGFYLTFLDDGCGMHYDDVFNVIVFGKSAKRHNLDPNQIGQYGNGLKSGAMRIANDFILLTKKDNIGTCLLISRTFHQEEHITQIVCPMPCFNLIIRKPIETLNDDQIKGTYTYTYDKNKHDLEMHLITKYSPFKTVDDLFKQFDLIKSSSGTLIVLYNLKLSNTGEAELDIKTDPYDILIDSKDRKSSSDDDDSIPPEYCSLRAYVSILYYEPHMRITIQGRRVLTKTLPYTLYKPRQYQFKSMRFKTRSEQEIKKYETELLSLEERIREIDSQVYHLQQNFNLTTSMDQQIKLRKLQMHAGELKEIANRLRNGLVKKRLELKTTKSLTFIFGLNIQNRKADGVFIYNCGRLIKMYQKIGRFNKKTLYGRGIVGIVDVPSIVLEPTHNKQSFVDEKEYHFLLKSMAEYMRQYWSDSGIEDYVKEFWESFGYQDDQLDRPPSNDPEVVKRRQMSVPMIIQCDLCLKWRRLPCNDNAYILSQIQLASWKCTDNTDILNNKCSANEKLETIPEGKLKPKSSGSNKENCATSRSVSQFGRSLGNAKRTSSAEISSTTSNIRLKPKSKKKAKRLLKKQSKKSKSKSRAVSTDDAAEEESSESIIRPDSSQTSTSYKRSRANETLFIEDDNDSQDTEHVDSSTSATTKNHLPPPTIGARISAMHQGVRRSGVVLSVNDKYDTFKMRFDESPTAEFDCSFSYHSPAWSYIGTVPPSTDPTITSAKNTTNDEEFLCTITKKFKTLIKFMLPPDWELTSEQISSMSYDDLSQFDITAFMQSYRAKMTKIIEQHKIDEAQWRTSAQNLQIEATKLLNLIGMTIPNDCSMGDFDEHVQRYITESEKIS